MIKAIPTEYKGYKMRSRTEARWAYVLDCTGIVWNYEKEGYDIGNKWYLPDFFLQTTIKGIDTVIIEVKGDKPTEDEVYKASQLSELLGIPVMILYGTPGDHGWLMYYGKSVFSSERYGSHLWYSFAGIKVSEGVLNRAYDKARTMFTGMHS